MLITAEQKNSRQSDRKVRLVANSVKKLSVPAALKQLAVMEKKASTVVMKVLSQAIANAVHNHGLTLNDLTIQSILVNSGTHYKRFRAVSRGRAHSILKRTCHVKVTLTSAPPALTKVAPKAVVAPKVSAAPKPKLALKTQPTQSPASAVKKSNSTKRTTKKATSVAAKKESNQA